MMGRQTGGQDRLFYAFDLDAIVPTNHLLRGIDKFLDLSALRQHLSSFYSYTGRPSVDPELMMRILIVGYAFGIRSERRLCEEVRLNLAYRWFCRLGLEDPVPDHSTFSVNRHGRFRDSGLFRHVFESVLARCMKEGLVSGEGFAVDASIIKADANRQRGVPGTQEIDWNDPALTTRPVREYLAALDEAADGASPRKPSKRISLTDPQSQWTAAPGGPAFYAYSANYLIDLNVGVIVDTETTTALRTDEVAVSKMMIERVADRFGLRPKRLAADTAYGTAATLAWLVEDKQIAPHIPVWDKSEGKDGLFGRSDFTWQAATARYLCPGGTSLQRYRRTFKKKRTGITKDNTIIYRASKYDCMICPLKPQCCPRTPSRKIARSIHEEARDHARALAKTPAYEQSRNDRKKVEMSFAHLKRILKLDRLRLRGMSSANDELLLAATAQNLRKMAKLIWRPPKNDGIIAPA